MTTPISPGSYVKCIRSTASEPEIVRVIGYIDEPSYQLQPDGGEPFYCGASLVDTLSPAEEIAYWRDRALAAETPKPASKPTLVEPAPSDTSSTVPGITRKDGVFIATCGKCQTEQELENEITAIAATNTLTDDGWKSHANGLTCPVCVELGKAA